MSVKRKLRKLANYPEHFVRDMRPPWLRWLVGPVLLQLGKLLGKIYGDERSARYLGQSRHRTLQQYRAVRSAESEVSDYTEHLFQDKIAPFRKGIASLPWHVRGKNVHVPEMLDFGCVVAPLVDMSQASDVDVFCTFGVTNHRTHNLAREAAEKLGKPLLSLEYGFISSVDIALKDVTQYSLILSKGSIYYDSTQPSHMEDCLNASDFEISNAQTGRTRRAIARIVETRVTKYNHAPELDLKARMKLSEKPRVLLVDQRFGDASVAKGLASPDTFEQMMRTACSLHDHEILVKLHPDAIGAQAGSYFGKLLETISNDRIKLVDFDVNPFSLFDVVDKVFVATSQLGFEALMANKEVHCFGVPFYAGWGLTHDHIDVPRRVRSRTLEEVFWLFYLSCSRYYVPGVGLCELECLIDYIAAVKSHPRIERTDDESRNICIATPDGRVTKAPAQIERQKSELRVLFVIPSSRFGATGRCVQDLALALSRHGCRSMVLCDGATRAEYAGIPWFAISFEGMQLSPEIRKAIIEFDPQIIYENGVRSRAQRATIEALLLTNARLAMQSEDDDHQVYLTHHPHPDLSILTQLDRPQITLEQITEFIKQNDWEHSLNVFADPAFDRWVEPVLRILCYRLAGLHTAIWRPFAERLQAEFDVPTMVVPPVIPIEQYDPTPISTNERRGILTRMGVNPESYVFYLAGTTYDYSDEYSIFLAAMNALAGMTNKRLSLVVVSGRSNLNLSEISRRELDQLIDFVDLDTPDDNSYLNMLTAADVICAPGIPDTFNRYRLPSRLVKAMALGKAILTFRVGFGESLRDGHEAFLTDGEDPIAWARVMKRCLDRSTLRVVGQQARAFAEAHFDADPTAKALKEKFDELLTQPPALQRMPQLNRPSSAQSS